MTSKKHPYLTIERLAVKSSHVSELGYDVPSRTLEVAFHDHSLYRYFDVPIEVFGEFMAAKSKGTFFHDRILKVFEYERQ